AGLSITLAVLTWFAPETTQALEPKAPLVGLNEADHLLVESGMESFDEARQLLWENTEPYSAVLENLRQASSFFGRVSNRAAGDYLNARVELNAGRTILGTGDEGEARKHFQLAMDLSESSLQTGNSSEAWRVRADAGSSWMLTKGLGGIIRMAPKVAEWSDRSLIDDPENALAIIISSQGQINAPKAAGGDPDAAARRLEALILRDDLDDIERFWGRVSLAAAYEKLGRSDEAERLCRSASEIFPENSMVQDCP
ncbi:MAG: tetratricopeptide repeat protein, partial [Spirochaetaceae bacterium]|nr:tetratricopeptide repeat protein [Spirochaetaceae bacterium]